MPIVTFHLADNCCTESETDTLIREASELYARVLESPIERVRVFIKTYHNHLLGVAGKCLAENHKGAPFFEFFVLRGRPQNQRYELMLEFTRLLARLTGVEQSQIRGRCIQLDPDDWSIGGIPASEMRKEEIKARAGAVAN